MTCLLIIYIYIKLSKIQNNAGFAVSYSCSRLCFFALNSKTCSNLFCSFPKHDYDHPIA